MDILLRALIGGVVVSAFALVADVLKPKRFAGLFGAAPSVALASLGLAIAAKGQSYAALEARSMVAGAIAFFVYAYFTCIVIMKYKPSAMACTLALMIVWAGTACGIWWVWLR
jgi:uncharacterized membrane protein (GlpM family)